jgi:hypothetical protein
MAYPQHIDHLLRNWPYRAGDVLARIVRANGKRQVLQMRIDMGLLQLEMDGRPDGERPEGFSTYYDYLVSLAFHEGESFVLDEDRCTEIDREFVQFYHRRICWLSLRKFQKAVKDADHTLALMDFSSAHAPDEEWALSHEQYRPFVIFHRYQASALAALEEGGPEPAIEEIEEGLRRLRDLFANYEAEDRYEGDELVQRLRELKESLRKHYKIGPSLAEQLAEAVAEEKYELAARIRDEIRRRGKS